MWERVRLPPKHLLKHPQIMAKPCFLGVWVLCTLHLLLLRAACKPGTASLQTMEKG